MNITGIYFGEHTQSVPIMDFSVRTLPVQVILGGNVRPTFSPWCCLMGLKASKLR